MEEFNVNEKYKYSICDINKFINKRFNEHIQNSIFFSKNFEFKIRNSNEIIILDNVTYWDCILNIKDYNIIIKGFDIEYVYNINNQKWDPCKPQDILNRYPANLLIMFENFSNIDEYITILKQIYDAYPFDELCRIKSEQLKKMDTRFNKYIIHKLEIPISVIKLTLSLNKYYGSIIKCNITFNIDNKIILVEFYTHKYNEYDFSIHDFKTDNKYSWYIKNNVCLNKKNNVRFNIADNNFNKYNYETKLILETFANCQKINKTKSLEQIYNYFMKLYKTTFLYNYEKCIIILTASKYKRFHNIPYDVVKIIAYYALQ